MSMEFIWYGHGTFGLAVGKYMLLVDPFLEDNPSASVSPANVPADYILVSHGHGDHTNDVIPIANRTGALVISNFELAGYFEKKGLKTHAQHIGGGFHHPFGYLKFTLALHGSQLPDGSDGGNPVGFLLTTASGQRVYLACDTGLFGDMRLIGEEGIDLAVLPIGDNFTMGPDDALRAVKLIQPRHVIPVHYGTWELIAQDPKAWGEKVRRETAAEVHVLRPGESFSI